MCVAACSESEAPASSGSQKPAPSGPHTLFDELQPFDPDSISVSVELENDLQHPEVIEDAAVWLSTVDGAFVRLQKGHVAINGTPLSRWDQAARWNGYTTHYTGDDIPAGEGEIVVSLVLPDQPSAELARFAPPAAVNLNGIAWPESIVAGQRLTVSWAGIAPLDHLGVAESTLKKVANEREMYSGRIEPMAIGPTGSMDLGKALMDRHKRHIEISGREPAEARLTYARIEFGTHTPGRIAEGIAGSEAAMHLFVSREVRE